MIPVAIHTATGHNAYDTATLINQGVAGVRRSAALMIQSNALIPIKLAAQLCGISRQEIYRRIQNRTFPKPRRLSGRKNSIRKAFYLQDIHDWIRNPTSYRWSEN